MFRLAGNTCYFTRHAAHRYKLMSTYQHHSNRGHSLNGGSGCRLHSTPNKTQQFMVTQLCEGLSKTIRRPLFIGYMGVSSGVAALHSRDNMKSCWRHNRNEKQYRKWLVPWNSYENCKALAPSAEIHTLQKVIRNSVLDCILCFRIPSGSSHVVCDVTNSCKCYKAIWSALAAAAAATAAATFHDFQLLLSQRSNVSTSISRIYLLFPGFYSASRM